MKWTGRALIALMMIAVWVAAGTWTRADAEDLLGARHPNLSPDGSMIAFSYMGDIWTVPSEGGRANRITVHESYDRTPIWSPDGTRLAFSSNRFGNDDIWVVDAGGGRAERRTWHSAADQVVGWSATGDEIYFASRRESRQPHLFLTDRNGSHPLSVIRERTLHAAVSPDGEQLLWVKGYTPWWRKHYKGSASRDIWTRATGGGESVRLTQWEGDDEYPMWAADGKAFYFLSERDDGVANIWKAEIEYGASPARMIGQPVQITHHDEWSIESASIAANGSLIAYERHGKLYTVTLSGGEPEQVAIDLESDDKWNRVRYETATDHATEFAVSPDESEVAIVVHGEVFVMELDDGEGTDQIRRITDTPARERHVAWAPDGESIYFASDRNGQTDIIRAYSTDSDEKRLSRSRRTATSLVTDTPDNELNPVPSPDGERVAFLRGAGYAHTIKIDGGDERLLLPGPDVLYTRWSPDSKWVAVSQSNLGGLEDVLIAPASGGEAYNVSRAYIDDYSPFWTGDGKRLVYASRDNEGNLWLKYVWLTEEEFLKSESERKDEERLEDRKKEKTEKESKSDDDADEEEVPVVAIDFDGLHSRSVTVTRLSGGYNPFAVTPDGDFFAVVSNQLGSNDIWLVNREGDRITRLASGGGGSGFFRFREDSRAIYYLDGGGRIKLSEFDDDGESKGGPKGVSFEARYDIDLAAEAEQKYSEAWSLLNDGFYDDRFHGADWGALRAAYAPRAHAAYTLEEFRDVLSELIGELSASHLGVWLPGGKGGDATAFPGFYIDPTYSGRGVRINHVLDRGPADRSECKIQVGEFILAIDGEELEAGASYYAMLNRKAGEKVDMIVAETATGKGSREVTIIPVSPGRAFSLIWEDWKRENRLLAEILSNGRVGYIALAAMGAGDIARFEREIIAETGDRDALILDIRFNNGGSVHDQVITILQRRPYAKTKSRGREGNLNPYEMLNKPVVCLINERSYSDGEIFPHAFKTLDLGTVVGVPTYGAVIGTNNVPLIDGTMFRIPGTGWYGLDGKSLENNGVTPDVYVESIPEERAAGRDIQIERAVEILLEQTGSTKVSAKNPPVN